MAEEACARSVAVTPRLLLWPGPPWPLPDIARRPEPRPFSSWSLISRPSIKAIETSKLLGKSVQNDKNQKIGTLDDLVVTKDHALFGVLQVGAFLGLGGHPVAVPYDSLDISDDGRKIVVAGASKESSASCPNTRRSNSRAAAGSPGRTDVKSCRKRRQARMVNDGRGDSLRRRLRKTWALSPPSASVPVGQRSSVLPVASRERKGTVSGLVSIVEALTIDNLNVARSSQADQPAVFQVTQ